MPQTAVARVTREEYLAHESVAQGRSEYRDGIVYAMSGGSLNHGRLVYALGGEVRSATEGTSCEGFGPEVKLRVESADAYYYSDAMVVCGEVDVESESNGIVRNPIVVFEVLSPSTARFDRKAKFLDYQSVPSIQEIVFVYGDRRLAERYERQDDASWRYTAYVGDARLPIAAAGIELELARLYARTDL